MRIVTLIPFVTFSTFHSLTFIRQNVIPVVFPGNTNALARQFSQMAGTFVQQYQTKALTFVAFAEVWLIMPYLIISILGGYASLLSPLLYGHFLRFRYFFSPMTKHAFRELRTRADKFFLTTPQVPLWARNAFIKVRDMIIKFGDMEGLVQQPDQAAQ